MQLRGAASLAIVVLGLALAGCATTPSDSEYSSLPPAPRHGRGPAPDAPAPNSQAAKPPPMKPVAQLPSNEYADLLDRIRAGFKLQDVEHWQVDKQVQYYAARQDLLDRSLARGARYMHHIVTEIEKRGLPMELALLPIVESAFNPVAYSRSRASGLWQFIPSTGKHYGLEQNWWMDERRDVIEATSAALTYLDYLNRYFQGDWLLAIAAYNGGEGGVGRAVKRSVGNGRGGDFFSLDLVTETREYVPKLLALRRLVGNPEAYGLRFASIPNEPYFTIVEPGRQVRLDEVAELAGVPKEEVLALNPAFNRMSTPPHGPHRVLLPIEAAGTYAQAVTDGRQPTVRQATVVYHSVRRGENLSSIARRYGVSTAELRAANSLSGSTIQPGQQLLVPVAGGSVAGGAALASAEARADLGNQLPERQAAAAPRKPTRHLVKPGDSLWSVARLHGVSVPELAAENGISSKSQLNTGQSLRIPRGGSSNTRLAARDGDAVRTTYLVRRGDTLSGIARRFDVSVQQIKDWNQLPSSNSVKAGQRLVVYVGADRVRGG